MKLVAPFPGRFGPLELLDRSKLDERTYKEMSKSRSLTLAVCAESMT